MTTTDRRVQSCDWFWGSHGCNLPLGHGGEVHVCGPMDCGWPTVYDGPVPEAGFTFGNSCYVWTVEDPRGFRLPPRLDPRVAAGTDQADLAAALEREATWRGIVKRYADGWVPYKPLPEWIRWASEPHESSEREPMSPAEVLLLQEVLDG